MFQRAARWMERGWWGFAVAELVLIGALYVAISQFAEPLGLPESADRLPSALPLRAVLIGALALLLAPHLTLGLALVLRHRDQRSAREADRLIVETYPRSQHPRFFTEVERLIPTSRRIVLIAIGLNLIWERHILDMLIRRASSGETEVTVCMGNPYNPRVQERWVEELQTTPPRGARGARASIRALLDEVARAGGPPGFEVLLFEHYPTFAVLIFDDHLFVYPYGYRQVGNFSPIFHLRDDGSDEVRFFTDHAARVLADAVPATDVIAAHADRRHFSDRWLAAAVYFVPDGDSELYQFGSAVLGYDVRAQRDLQPDSPDVADLRQYAGKAREFGLHMTLADALYFIGDAEIRRLRADLQTVSEGFDPFTLTNLRVTRPFRGARDLVVQADDGSGTLELLHQELVSRVYSCAISSNYLTGRTHNPMPAKRQARARLVTERFGAPYILSEFVPHFTLCTELPADEGASRRLADRARALFEGRVRAREVSVREICLLLRRPGEDRWSITDRYPLNKLF